MRLILFLLLSIQCMALQGQFLFNDEVGNSDNYRLRHFNSDNGLPQNSVKGMAFDLYGNLWLGTESGLVMFDGVNFRTAFNINTGLRIHGFSKMSDNRIVYYDSKDNAYIINEETGTVVSGNYDDKIQYKNNFKYVLESIPDAISDSLLENGINIYLNRTTSNNQNYIKTWDDELIYFDSTRIVYLGTEDEFKTYKTLGDKFFYFSEKEYRIYKDAQVQGKDNKVYDYDTQTPIKLDLTKAFFFEHPDQPFVLHEGTLYEMIYKEKKLYFKKIIEYLPDFGPIKHGTYDPAQKIWAFGSHLIGLFLVQQSPLRSALSRSTQFNNNSESEFYASSVGTILELTDGGKLTDNGFVYYADGRSINFGNNNSRLYAFFEDYQGNIYAPNFKDKEVKVYDANLGLKESFEFPEFFRSIYQYSDTQILALTYKALIMIYPQDNYRTEILYENHGLLFNKLYKYDEESFWLLSTEGIFEVKNDFKEISTIPGTEHKYMRHCGRISNGEMLLFTYGEGYFIYKNEKMIPLPLDQDGYLKFAHYFLEDNNGFLWIPTNKGLFQLSVEDILSYAKGEVTNVYYNYYDKTYGFYNNEFNGGGNQPGLISEKDGLYWMGNLIGPVVLDPYIHSIPLPINPIRIQRIEFSDSILYDMGIKLQLQPDFNRITFTVSSAYFGHPNNLRMEYRLIGWDERWYPIDPTNSFTINNLSKGEYVLEVRKLRGFGKDNFDVMKYSFTVLPYFYETWWFLLLVSIIMFLAILLLIQIRTFQLNRRNLILENIVKDRTHTLETSILNLERASEKNQLMISIITHDIKGPLKFISQVMQSMNNNLSKLSEGNLKAHFATLTESTDKLYLFVLEFLQWFQIDKKSFEGHGTTEFSLREALISIKDFAYATGIVKDNTILIDENTDVVITNKKPLVETIFRNLIENAAKNTRFGKISISAEIIDEGRRICIVCKDNGTGMSRKQIDQIFKMDKQGRVYFENRFHLGYGLIFSLLKEINGEIEIESELGEGTEIRVSLPIK